MHLKLCNLTCKIQVAEGRHAHLENPWTSAASDQKVLTEFLQRSLAARLDPCMFGLKHPENQDLLQKITCIQTTSKAMFQTLDSRTCSHDHVHCQITGTCKWKDHRIGVSKIAGFYPRTFAKQIVLEIIKTKDGAGGSLQPLWLLTAWPNLWTARSCGPTW